MVQGLPITRKFDEECLTSIFRKHEARTRVWDQYGDEIITRPVDKRENFIKRCVAIAGDTLQIKNRIVYINNVAEPLPEFHEFKYDVTTTAPLDPDQLNDMGIQFNMDDQNKNQVNQLQNNLYEISMTDGEMASLKMLPTSKKYPACSSLMPER